MRRLWAHIIIAFAAVVAVFASIPALISKISTNGEYETRRQFTFQLSKREKQDDDDDPKELTKDSAKEMAKIMEKRLIAYDISSYDITTTGNKDVGDIINVTFYAESADKYKNVITYLGFSGSFALVNNNDDLVESDLFRRGNAYIKEASVNDYPTIVLPVKTDTTEWENLVENATKNPISESSGESSEGEEEKDYDCEIFFFIDYNNIDENDETGTKLIRHFEWYTDKPLALSGKVPQNPTHPLDPAFPYFVGWSSHTIIDSLDDLWKMDTDVVGSAHFLYLYGIWSDVPSGS